MKYTTQQQKYVDSVGGQAHMSAVIIIGLLERTIQAQSRLLVSYRFGDKPPEWVFDTLDKAKSAGIEI